MCLLSPCGSRPCPRHGGEFESSDSSLAERCHRRAAPGPETVAVIGSALHREQVNTAIAAATASPRIEVAGRIFSAWSASR
jgi:hypothetical protein